jgi:hypothetical protein
MANQAKTGRYNWTLYLPVKFNHYFAMLVLTNRQDLCHALEGYDFIMDPFLILHDQ